MKQYTRDEDKEENYLVELRKNDYSKYVFFCNELGITPKPKIKSLVNSNNKVNKKSKKGHIKVNPLTYREFLDRAKSYTSGDSNRLYGHRKDLLIQFFPKRFGNGGGMDLEARAIDSNNLYGVFKHMVEYAEKVVRKYNL